MSAYKGAKGSHYHSIYELTVTHPAHDITPWSGHLEFVTAITGFSIRSLVGGKSVGVGGEGKNSWHDLQAPKAGVTKNFEIRAS